MKPLLLCMAFASIIFAIHSGYHQTQAGNGTPTSSVSESSVSDGSTEAQWNKYHQSLQPAPQPEQRSAFAPGSEAAVIEWMIDYCHMTRPFATLSYDRGAYYYTNLYNFDSPNGRYYGAADQGQGGRSPATAQ
jgi:hypothetical protein